MLFAGFFWGIKGLILRAESIILKIKQRIIIIGFDVLR